MRNQNNYKAQNGCHNCLNCLEDTPQDDGTYFYCNLNREMTTKMFFASVSTLSHKKYEQLRMWMGENEVDGHGICDKWQVITIV